MSRFHILVSGSSAPDDAVEQSAAGTDAVLDIIRASPGHPTELPAALCERAGAIAHCTPSQPLPNPPEAFPRCRIFVRNGFGFDNIDIKAWGQRGIPVCNILDYGTAEVANHAIALMLAFTRGTATYIDALKGDLAETGPMPPLPWSDVIVVRSSASSGSAVSERRRHGAPRLSACPLRSMTLILLREWKLPWACGAADPSKS